MIPHADRLTPGPARLSRRSVVAGLCVALLAAGCAPGRHGPAGASAAVPAAVPGGAGPASSAASAAAFARGRWSVLAASPLGSRQGPVVAWTGTELLEIGGWGGNAPLNAGAAFDPAVGSAGRWRRIAPAPVPVGALAASVWTGSRLFVFGGQQPGRAALGPAAALYDPVSGRWAVTAAAPFGRGLREPVAVWTGRLIVVAGVDGSRVEVASYDPVTGRWRRQDPPLPAAHPALGIAMLAAGGRVILWSLWGSFAGSFGVDVRALAEGRWRDVTGRWPQDQTVPPPLFTGRQILVPPGQVWCGACSPPSGGLPGFLADPATLRITPLPRGPLDDAEPVMVWASGVALAINPGTEISGPGINVRPGGMAAWDPASGTWRRLPSAPGPLQEDLAPVWTGRELLTLAADGTLLGFAA
jgi:hypothetical protein